jgi:hypothetical protein
MTKDVLTLTGGRHAGRFPRRHRFRVRDPFLHRPEPQVAAPGGRGFGRQYELRLLAARPRDTQRLEAEEEPLRRELLSRHDLFDPLRRDHHQLAEHPLEGHGAVGEGEHAREPAPAAHDELGAGQQGRGNFSRREDALGEPVLGPPDPDARQKGQKGEEKEKPAGGGEDRDGHRQ